MGHIERKQREKENTRNAIMKAALEIAIAEGWQAVTIRKISEAVEYTTSIVYGHFESKEALLLEIRDSGYRQMYEISEKALKAETDPKKQLLTLSLVNWDFACANKELYHLMFNLNRPSGDLAFKGMDLIENIFTKLTGKNREEIKSLFLNWICLRRGCINLLIDFRKPDSDIDPRNLYIEFMERFISSITPS
jgi:AcrR family transcriptional regulator